MKRTAAIVLAVAMLSVASPAFMTQASENRDPGLAYEDSIFFEAGTDHPGSEGEAVCTDEDAHTVTSIDTAGLRDNTYCTTGSHDPAVYSITHGPDLDRAAQSGFTGIVESIIQYDGGERRWACSFSSGTWLTCAGAGAWPGQATEFCHDVWVYETQGAPSQPLFTGFATGCPNGDIQAAGLGLGSNTQPAGDGQPEGMWGAYVVHG